MKVYLQGGNFGVNHMEYSNMSKLASYTIQNVAYLIKSHLSLFLSTSFWVKAVAHVLI